MESNNSMIRRCHKNEVYRNESYQDIYDVFSILHRQGVVSYIEFAELLPLAGGDIHAKILQAVEMLKKNKTRLDKNMFAHFVFDNFYLDPSSSTYKVDFAPFSLVVIAARRQKTLRRFSSIHGYPNSSKKKQENQSVQPLPNSASNESGAKTTAHDDPVISTAAAAEDTSIFNVGKDKSKLKKIQLRRTSLEKFSPSQGEREAIVARFLAKHNRPIANVYAWCYRSETRSSEIQKVLERRHIQKLVHSASNILIIAEGGEVYAISWSISNPSSKIFSTATMDSSSSTLSDISVDFPEFSEALLSGNRHETRIVNHDWMFRTSSKDKQQSSQKVRCELIDSLWGTKVDNIACSDNHLLVVSDHKVFSWGFDHEECLDPGASKTPLAPLKIEALSFTEYLNKQKFIEGKRWYVKAFYNVRGQTNTNHEENPEIQELWSKFLLEVGPRVVRELKDIHYVACGSSHSIAITLSGDAYSWGNGTLGRLGIEGCLPVERLPRRLPTFRQALCRIACGSNHSIALSKGGYLWSWGCGAFGQLGHGDYDECYQPRELELLKDKVFVHVDCGDDHTAVLSSEGLVYTFGSNWYGQLGRPFPGRLCDAFPAIVKGGLDKKRVCLLSCTRFSTLAATRCNLLYIWGHASAPTHDKYNIGGFQDFQSPQCLDILSIVNEEFHSCNGEDSSIVHGKKQRNILDIAMTTGFIAVTLA